jgi:hypothetical protein
MQHVIAVVYNIVIRGLGKKEEELKLNGTH